MVIVGPRGSGKTCLVQFWTVQKALSSREKVVEVKLTCGTQLIEDAVRNGLTCSLKDKDNLDLDKVFEPFKDTRGDEKPVLLVELDSFLNETTMRTQPQVAKMLSCDRKLVRSCFPVTFATELPSRLPDPLPSSS
mmetsp:Transcript_415/g.1605  ORF Transcript_415/g.1605 Transcript_415/m.1605 type:complete len:135 (-) Transcript_415:521-925(-)